jgi:Sec-independent protein translocase protein TatA
MPDMLFILLLALVLLGPKKLPQVAAQIGKYLAEFHRVRRELLDQVSAEVLAMDGAKKTNEPSGSCRQLAADSCSESLLHCQTQEPEGPNSVAHELSPG